MSTTAVDDGSNRVMRCMQKGSFGALLFGFLNPDFGGLGDGRKGGNSFRQKRRMNPYRLKNPSVF